MTQRIVLATGNKGMVREFSELLAARDISIVPQSDFAVPEADETGLTFVENAIIKARNAAAHTGLPAIADDSGLEVDFLKGAPGIYSARYAGEGANDQDNNNKMLGELEGVPEADRTARYWCILVFMRHENDPVPIITQASWEGRILEAPRGDGGFGYDPIFLPNGYNVSFAEMSMEEKGAISHRGRAVEELVGFLVDNL